MWGGTGMRQKPAAGFSGRWSEFGGRVIADMNPNAATEFPAPTVNSSQPTGSATTADAQQSHRIAVGEAAPRVVSQTVKTRILRSQQGAAGTW
jgi:hypothetical protein